MSASTNDSRRFVYGDNEYKSCGCPAVSAGFNVERDNLLTAAELYDDYIRDNTEGDDWRGFVTEKEAKEAWLYAIHVLEGRTELYETEREMARQVADELGWLDE